MPAILAIAYGSLVGSSPPRHQVIFLDGLLRQARIDAGRAEEQQLPHAGAPGFVDDVGFHQQVVVDEVGRIGIVGVDAADLGRRQVDLVDALAAEECAYLSLVGQFQFVVAARDQVGMAARLQGAHDGRADQAAVTGDIDAGFCMIQAALLVDTRSLIAATMRSSKPVSTRVRLGTIPLQAYPSNAAQPLTRIEARKGRELNSFWPHLSRVRASF